MHRQELSAIFHQMKMWGLTPNREHFATYWMDSHPTYVRGCRNVGLRPMSQLADRLCQYATDHPIPEHRDWYLSTADELRREVAAALHS